MLADLDPKLWWWIARSSGIVAWALVTASILWGLALSTRLVRRRGVPAWLLDLHRYLGTLSVVFTGLHLAGLWADSYVEFGLRELFVPFASEWRTRAVAWGVVAFYLLAAIEATSWLMRRLPRKVWHAVHLSSIALFVFATVHTFLAGTDRGSLALQWFSFTGVIAVVFLLVFRVIAPKREARGERETRAPRDQPAPAPPTAPDGPDIDARIAALAARRKSAAAQR